MVKKVSIRGVAHVPPAPERARGTTSVRAHFDAHENRQEDHGQTKSGEANLGEIAAEFG